MRIKKYKFNKRTTIENPLRVFFLCGIKFNKQNQEDKRNVLKNYIETNYAPSAKVIILEEHFMFGKSKKGYLSYDDIYMKNLQDIELLTGLYSDKIFIIHESISTAAELGMLASNINLLKKTCLITPDNLSVEENKISAFISLAYFKSSSQQEKIENITFYPQVKKNIVSETKIDYLTYFPENKIKKKLGMQINNFIEKDFDGNFEINFRKSKYNKPFQNENTISYFHSSKKNKPLLNIIIAPSVLRVLLISLFNLSNFKRDIRPKSEITQAVGVVQEYFKSIVVETISEIEGIDFSNYQIYISLKDEKIKVREAIAYFLYILQALRMVKLPDPKEKKPHFVISPQFEKLCEGNFNILEEINHSVLTDSL